ncbi:hypothetical protein GQ457_10G011330 [Hibiscus cannabinus]
MTWVYRLKLKSDAVLYLRNFFLMVQNQFHSSVQILRSDNGTEFFNSACSSLFSSLGIIRQSSCIHTPQQNGVAERKQRHLLEVARALRDVRFHENVFPFQSLQSSSPLFPSHPPVPDSDFLNLESHFDNSGPASTDTPQDPPFDSSSSSPPNSHPLSVSPPALSISNQESTLEPTSAPITEPSISNPPLSSEVLPVQNSSEQQLFPSTEDASEQPVRRAKLSSKIAPKKGDNAKAAAPAAATEVPATTEVLVAIATLESMVTDLHTSVKDAVKRLNVVDDRLDELENKGDELKDDVNTAINKAFEGMEKQGSAFQDALATLKEEFQAKITKLETELVAKASSANSWYLDSGCSRHMTSDKSRFLEFKSKSGVVTFGDNSKGNIEGIGSIGNHSFILIDDVLHVNGLKHNLLSISQLCDKGFNVFFESNGCKIINIETNQVVLAVHRIENIYMVHLDDIYVSNACFMASNEHDAWNKLDESGNIVRNKARLVAQCYTQEEGIDFDETYALVARMEAIRMLLAFACHHEFKLFQMDVKSTFLNGFINEELYVEQPPGFEDPKFSNHVFKLSKALYGLKQAPRAWYESMIGELSFFLGLQIKQRKDGIFINQAKYIKEKLKKFGIENVKSQATPMSSSIKFDKDEEGKPLPSSNTSSYVGGKRVQYLDLTNIAERHEHIFGVWNLLKLWILYSQLLKLL